MSPEIEQRLRDALRAAELIERASRNQSRDGYLDDEWFQSAAERNLEIIGEALNQASRIEPVLSATFPDIRGWVGLRNILAHAYNDVRVEVIWDTIKKEVPELVTYLRDILDDPSNVVS